VDELACGSDDAVELGEVDARILFTAQVADSIAE
jgi:hypothetical protein